MGLSNTRIFICACFGALAVLVSVALVVYLRVFKSSYNFLFQAKQSFIFTPETISHESELGKGSFSWRIITKFKEVGGWTLLYQTRSAVIAIPDSAFASASDLIAFHQLIAKKKVELKQKKLRKVVN